MSSLRGVLIVGFGLPALVLAGSYAWLALDHGTPWLWDVVVHESGRYTLGETVFYYGHFLREIPTVVAFVLFLLGGSGAVAGTASGSAGPARRTGWVALVLAAILVSWTFFRAAGTQGWETALLDLVQYRTRDDLVGFGTHWRYHWASTLWFGAAVGLAPALTRRSGGVAVLAPHRPWMAVAWGYFLLLTLLFGLSGDVFLDPRYTGHQAREILTHAPTTLWMGLAVVVLAGIGEGSGPNRHASLPRWLTWVFAALGASIPLFLAAVALFGDVMAHGQSELGLAAMVAAHYFEHSLDYLLVLLLLVVCLAFMTRGRLPSSSSLSPRRQERDHARR